MLGNLKVDLPENTIGFESSEDCAVFPLDDDHFLIQSVDFFTPIVDDPYTFGQIAAANSLSDIYAMGGMPLHALNIAEFPSDDLPLEYIHSFLPASAATARTETIAWRWSGYSGCQQQPRSAERS